MILVRNIKVEELHCGENRGRFCFCLLEAAQSDGSW